MHIGRSSHARHVEEGLGKVDIRDEGGVNGARCGHAGPANKQRRAHGLFEDPALIIPTMLAEVEPLVGRIDDDGVLHEAFLFEELQHAADVVIDRLHATEVIMHIALVAPLDEVTPLGLGLAVGFIDRTVIGIPGLGLFRRDARRMHQLHVQRANRLFQSHVLVADRKSPVLVIIEQSCRLRINAALIPAEVRQIRRPLAVRCLLLTHQHEGLALIAPLHPSHRRIRGDIRHVASGLDHARRRLHRWIVVDALALQNLPVVEALWVAVEVPLADEGSLIAGSLKEFREGRLRAVKDGVGVIIKAVQVGILTRQDDRAAWTTDRIRHQSSVKAHALLGNTIDIGGLD